MGDMTRLGSAFMCIVLHTSRSRNGDVLSDWRRPAQGTVAVLSMFHHSKSGRVFSNRIFSVRLIFPHL
jgi:hypothetical protein